MRFMKRGKYSGGIGEVADCLWGMRERKESRMESTALLWMTGLLWLCELVEVPVLER